MVIQPKLCLYQLFGITVIVICYPTRIPYLPKGCIADTAIPRSIGISSCRCATQAVSHYPPDGIADFGDCSHRNLRIAGRIVFLDRCRRAIDIFLIQFAQEVGRFSDYDALYQVSIAVVGVIRVL